MTLLPRRAPGSVQAAAGRPLDAATLQRAQELLDDVQARGLAAVREHARQLDGLDEHEPLLLGRAELADAFAALPSDQQQLLQRTAARIAAFATAQRQSLHEFDLPIPGGVASQRIVPVARAGCYAHGGRAILPSSLLMTAVTARVAGCAHVAAACPRPAPIVLGAAHVASVDTLLVAGGAHAIGALAFGIAGLPANDVVVGPGNRFVAAAKQLVQGRCGIDLPAGPSELCVVVDASADPGDVAADLLAQAEHDPEARPWLLSTSLPLLDAVDAELARQLATLPTAATARQALANGGAVHADDPHTLLAVLDRLAPEHLQLAVVDPDWWAKHARHYGALFAGRAGAEVFGDYGAGPNHVLPTAGAARYSGGLSVLHFLRVRTWLRLDGDCRQLAADAAALADLEGLPGHAAAARRRQL